MEGVENVDMLAVDGDAPDGIMSILAEVNASVEGREMKELIASWLNRAVGCATESLMWGSMQLPRDMNGVPCRPGDKLAYSDGQKVVVVAVDGENVFYSNGGSIPTSVALSSQFRHVGDLTVGDCLDWYEQNVVLAEDGEEKQRVRGVFVDMLREVL